jgi:two-component system response regulator
MVEDNSDDIRLAWEAFRESGVPVRLYFVIDGAELFEFLRRRGKYRSAPRPDLILLDLHLAMMDGHEILAALKRDPEFTCIPVVVLTTSEDEEDIVKAYQMHANCFVTKPVELDQFMRVVQGIGTFWFATASLPTRMIHAHT